MATAHPPWTKINASIYSSPVEYKETPITEDYDVLWQDHLGTGVSGPVRLCVHKATGEKRALKVLVDREKSRSEISLHWSCSGSPYIVNILDVYKNAIQVPGEATQDKRIRLLVVMELMEGRELFEYISRKRRFTEDEACGIAVQISRAIGRCHSKNIAHRDLKPENLLITKAITNYNDPDLQVTIKLSDFGFAKIDNGDMKTPQFTPYYVAPQILQAHQVQSDQARGRLPPGSPYYYDKSCDMWSFGVILYIMLCGYPPFYSEIQGQALSNRMKRNILAGDYTFSGECWNSISDDAKDVIRKLLVVEASERMRIEDFSKHPWVTSKTPIDARPLPSPENLDAESIEMIKEAHQKVLAELRSQSDQFVLAPPSTVFSSNPLVQRRKVQQKIHLTSPLVPSPLNEKTSLNDKLSRLPSPMEVTLPSPPLLNIPENVTFEQKICNIIDILKMPPPTIDPPTTGLPPTSSGPPPTSSGPPPTSKGPPPTSMGPPSPNSFDATSNKVLYLALEDALSRPSERSAQCLSLLSGFSWNGKAFTEHVDRAELATKLNDFLADK